MHDAVHVPVSAVRWLLINVGVWYILCDVGTIIVIFKINLDF